MKTATITCFYCLCKKTCDKLPCLTRHEPLAKASVAPADASEVLQQELLRRECRETRGPAAWVSPDDMVSWRICQVTSPSLMPRNRPAGATTSGASLLAATKLPRDKNHRSAMTSLELAAFGFKRLKMFRSPKEIPKELWDILRYLVTWLAFCNM